MVGPGGTHSVRPLSACLPSLRAAVRRNIHGLCAARPWVLMYAHMQQLLSMKGGCHQERSSSF